jgi:hypothetical protein
MEVHSLLMVATTRALRYNSHTPDPDKPEPGKHLTPRRQAAKKKETKSFLAHFATLCDRLKSGT